MPSIERQPRHEWDKPNRLRFKTERQCSKCGLVKVTHHEPEERCWTSFWRGLDKIAGARDRTPA